MQTQETGKEVTVVIVQFGPHSMALPVVTYLKTLRHASVYI